MARPALIWDMGGILYRYFTEILLEQAQRQGWPLDGVPLGPTGPVSDPDYTAMLAGAIDEARYLEIARERLAGVGLGWLDPLTAIDWSEQARPAVWRLIEAASRAGHPQALLTNDASKWLGPDWHRTWEPAAWFAAIVDVEDVGVRKPAPEPYLATAAALGLPPQECLFVDDMVVNCRGAEAVGMAAHHVDIREPERAMERLAARLGIEVSAA